MRNAEQILTNAIRHIRRTHMNTRSWTLTAADEQAIAILNDSRFWAGRFQPEFDRINHGPFEHPVVQVVGNERFEISKNAEGTVIAIDGHPIQFSIVLTDAQISKYIAGRQAQQAHEERTRELEESFRN